MGDLIYLHMYCSDENSSLAEITGSAFVALHDVIFESTRVIFILHTVLCCIVLCAITIYLHYITTPYVFMYLFIQHSTAGTCLTLVS